MFSGRSRRGAAITGAALAALAMLGGAPRASAHDGGPRGAVVQTSNGALRGFSRTRYDAWVGIPYAAPPVGRLRLKAPQPAARWSGVRDATHFGGRCTQNSGWDPGYEQPILNEDCLYLNVYVPHDSWNRGRDGRRPVMVWIHGGGFTGGAGQDTDPRKYIGQSGAVFVTLNYRLGALGFLNLPQLRTEGDAAGAYGLLDQQAALRWIQQNIGRFGGDARNVTIAGQSAGGSAVCDQLTSPGGRGLFTRAIIVSGGCSLTSQADADAAGQAYLKTIGCPDDATALSCVRAKTPAQLLAAQLASPIGVRPSAGGAAFPQDPAAAVAAGRFTRVPVISGQVHDERTLFAFQNNDYAGKPVTGAGYEAMIRGRYGANADRVLAAYPVSAYPSPSAALAAVDTDSLAYGRLLYERQLARYTPTYLYQFEDRGTPQFYSIFRLQQQGEPARSFPFGATHVDDLGYYFEYLGHTLPYRDDELELSDQMIGFWSAFQYRNTPNGTYLPEWPPFGRSQRYMALNACDTPEAGSQPPAACSQATDIAAFAADHQLGLWQSILG
jgi:carboxylesterase type B